MSFESIPNELVAKIFVSVPFQDIFQCSYVCRRFRNIILARFKDYYIDIWNVNQPVITKQDSIFTHMIAYRDCLISFHGGGADYFDCHPYKTGLYHTATSKKIQKAFLAALIPGTSMVAYCSYPDRNRLIVCDVKADAVRHDRAIPMRFYRIVCSRRAIVVTGMVNGRYRTHLYSWNGSATELLQEIDNGYFPAISDTGLLAYQQVRQRRRIDFIDCHAEPEVSSDCATGNGNLWTTGSEEFETTSSGECRLAPDNNEPSTSRRAGTESSDSGSDPKRARTSSSGQLPFTTTSGQLPVTTTSGRLPTFSIATGGDIRRFEITKCGRLVVTVEHVDENHIVIYNVKSRQAVYRIDIPEQVPILHDLKFATPRYLMLSYLKGVSMIDLRAVERQFMETEVTTEDRPEPEVTTGSESQPEATSSRQLVRWTHFECPELSVESLRYIGGRPYVQIIDGDDIFRLARFDEDTGTLSLVP